jgi:hypothetical protein
LLQEGYLTLHIIHSLVVVEAKRDDLTRGFTQLAVEMIALSMLEESPSLLYGAVTIGNLWIFGTLETAHRTITQDIGLYTLPDDLHDLVRTLVGILE